jgi:hypothetical protein
MQLTRAISRRVLMKIHIAWLLTTINLVLLLGVATVSANVPATSNTAIPVAAALGSGFTYQGQLNRANNAATGTCDFQFSLWDALSGGTQVSTTKLASAVALTKGLFTVQLDFGAGAFNGDARWLQIAVRCPAGSGAFTTLEPRQALTPSPYALRATSAGSVPWTGISGVPAGFADGVDDGGYSIGNGLSLQGSVLSVAIPLDLDGSDAISIARFHNHASTSNSTFANGLWATSDQGRGVEGNSASSLGVAGFSGTDVGVYGQSESAVGTVGYVTGGGSGGFGVVGQSGDSNGNGVGGFAHLGTQAYGVLGSSDQGVGVVGATNSGRAGVFFGDVDVNGRITKASGSFKIDHPLDPANKYLYHSFVESPDMKNIYDGVAILDASGAATVTMPDWFQALNQDFRYQLTAIGAPGPDLYIAKEIEGNTFVIAGGKEGMKVSWQVTGIRHDPYAEQNRIPVEENKPAQERGTYLYPQGYGQPITSLENYTQRARITQRLSSPLAPSKAR